ncbi:TatD family hydrolase [Inmirania thermothiophila]|uniref:TatD DNase family protein n=1 Tax=Inmirania thermothiophila TaxID=1750597 RepID=A0A3N1Y1C6_9GAMM|nr:TatD family hydrolase [Inmirania thermothiophila]ROR32625.1 TatD DNase family protein [Inmirania thermothiophila]
MELVDSHCHLDLVERDPQGDAMAGLIREAEAAGVAGMLVPGVSLARFERQAAVAERFPRNVVVAAGMHPNEARGEPVDEGLLREYASIDGVVAVGETGLDYYRCEGDLAWQQARFRAHIRVARDTGRPLIVHTRDAMEDTLRILEEEGAAEVGGVIHCFTGDAEEACRAVELGFHVSFSGIITFPNAVAVQEAARAVPLDRILVETDAPFLTPVPHRGRPNRPAYVRLVAERLAALRGLPLEAVAAATTANFRRLFRV